MTKVNLTDVERRTGRMEELCTVEVQISWKFEPMVFAAAMRPSIVARRLLKIELRNNRTQYFNLDSVTRFTVFPYGEA